MTNAFKAATWNVFHGTAIEKLEPVLCRLLNDGVSLFLIQEGSHKGIEAMLARRGLHFYRAEPQCIIAWDPDLWVEDDRQAASLAEQVFYRKGSHRATSTEAAQVELHDRYGRSLLVVSYHTPAHVQVKPSKRPKRRMQVLREAMRTLARLAKGAKTDAVLFGGDDNVDEFKAFRSTWKFMLKAATGLTLVQPPHATHGKRKIDDFRVKGLEVGTGRTIGNPSDHDIHVRTFLWKV